jgi:CRP-like cAMP-binding protein
MVLLNNDIIERLRSSVPFFTDFSNEELVAFLKLMKSETFKESDVIFKEFEKGDKMYIILKGSVQISRKMGKKNGVMQDTELAVLEAGECLGEMGLIDQRSRSATAKAKTTAVVFSISHDTLYKVSRNPKYSHLSAKLYRNFAAMLAKRLRESNDKLVDLSFKILNKQANN